MAKIRVRARAVDMLGRQQIAGIPTAIHELFKNAHDAYAERVEVDFFRADGLLVIRDDGFGMTRQEFEERWLTLGTESKVGANQRGAGSWTGPRQPVQRPIMGEKGIGRLAIAAIGPQVLVMTRAARPDGLHPLVASLIHWGLFEVPGIDLDSVEIPVEEVREGKLPDGALLARLADRIRVNIAALGPVVPSATRDQLTAGLELAAFDPGEIDRGLTGLSLRADGFGTHFYIRPTSPMLADDIDGGSEENASPLEKMLLGFSNTMMPERPSPAIVAEFRDHHEDGTLDELIGGKSFFTPEEFEAADHHIEGRFDEYGQFSGKVIVYRQRPREYAIQWPAGTGRPTECGPFGVKFAYLQGKAKDSRLPPDEWARLSAKLNRIGGLYVYRDGIRVLPYGNSDYDFLNIEKRRTKSAQDWFFSYRRIFGAVEITHRENGHLVEKAGREGFRANRAYREFVSMLENVFQRLALDFFRPTSQYGDEFNVIRDELNREAELLRRRDQATRGRRRELSKRLDRFFADLEKGAFIEEARRMRDKTAARLAAIRSIHDPNRAVQAVLEVEAEARAATAGLEQAITVTRPRGVGLTKGQQADWSAYVQNAEKLQRDVILPLRNDLDAMISEAVSIDGATLDRRRRVVASLEARRDTVTAGASRLRREVQDGLAELGKNVDEVLRSTLARLSTDFEQAFVDLGRTDTAELDDVRMRAWHQRWEDRIDRAAAEAVDVLEALRDQLRSLTAAVANRGTLDETTAAIETQAEAYRDQLDSYTELAQVGMALGIVQHEFGNAIGKVRGAIKKLKPWADGTPGLASLYQDLRSGFDHLDTYLRLFTPMSRRLNPLAVELSGEEIRLYLLEVFGDRLERNHIRLVATPAFDRKVVRGSPATFLPAFVNLIDNATYWLGTNRGGERVIKLDADAKGFTVSNTGPGIERRLAERIFEFGETTKPGGRGMGLYLSREALRKADYDLTLVAAGADVQPVFRIAPQADPARIEVASD